MVHAPGTPRPRLRTEPQVVLRAREGQGRAAHVPPHRRGAGARVRYRPVDRRASPPRRLHNRRRRLAGSARHQPLQARGRQPGDTGPLRPGRPVRLAPRRPLRCGLLRLLALPRPARTLRVFLGASRVRKPPRRRDGKGGRHKTTPCSGNSTTGGSSGSSRSSTIPPTSKPGSPPSAGASRCKIRETSCSTVSGSLEPTWIREPE